MESLTQRWSQSGSFFPKSGHIFQFSKMTGEASPFLPSWAHVNVAEYASISLNMSKYPWKCLIKLFWLSQSSEYSWSSHVRQAFEARMYMQGLRRVPNISDNGFIRLYNAKLCHNIPKCSSICLSMAKKAVLTVPGFSICRDIITMTLLLQLMFYC